MRGISRDARNTKKPEQAIEARRQTCVDTIEDITEHRHRPQSPCISSPKWPIRVTITQSPALDVASDAIHRRTARRGAVISVGVSDDGPSRRCGWHRGRRLKAPMKEPAGEWRRR